MGFINNLLCLAIYVLLFIFDSVNNPIGEKVHIYITKAKYTWFQVKNKCSLIGNESTNIHISTFDSNLMWTGDSARYLPWVEYLGCFGLKEERQLVVNRTNVETGKQLKALNVTERLDEGNCLAVFKKKDLFSYYLARDCSAKAFQICLRDIQYTECHQQNVLTGTWIDAFHLCRPSYMLSRYSLVYNNVRFTRTGTYWLSNTRRWIQGPLTNPEFCVAASVQQDGRLQRETNGNKASINKVLLISVIAATSLTILVAIVIVVLCIRMKRLQSNSSQNQIRVDGNNVVYAQVERPMKKDRTIDQATRQYTVEDTYDHMDHRCSSQSPPQEESSYDMMSNIAIVEENDYSHTYETDRERQCFIDASSEYSHVTVVAKPETID
ncbi:unnamed protein product [Mytilus coruscus]|uniref:C-type lectin domain-containing protein n=1 Tax=Mytilus coruscus TaxID=42192 RepID=A0A6J8BSL1_MYTCO|nr:unnamed protein product [Mytilus coruscus]